MTTAAIALLRRVESDEVKRQPVWFGQISIEGEQFKAVLQFPACAPCLVLSRERRGESVVFVNSADHGCEAELRLDGRPFIAALGREAGGYRLTVRRDANLWVAEADEPLPVGHLLTAI